MKIEVFYQVCNKKTGLIEAVFSDRVYKDARERAKKYAAGNDDLFVGLRWDF